jgi:hypothetical protein
MPIGNPNAPRPSFLRSRLPGLIAQNESEPPGPPTGSTRDKKTPGKGETVAGANLAAMLVERVGAFDYLPPG